MFHVEHNIKLNHIIIIINNLINKIMIKHKEIKLNKINFNNLESKSKTFKISIAYTLFAIGFILCVGALIISFVGL